MVDWATLGGVFAIVAPLYGSAFILHFRSGKNVRTREDVDGQGDDIESVEGDLREIKEEMATEEDVNDVKEAIVTLHADHERFQDIVREGDFLRGGGD